MARVIRTAVPLDVPTLIEVMERAILENQRAFLSEEQIASSRAIMGIDDQLVADGTYFVVEIDGRIAGCGGWSRRATLYGHNATPGRDARLLNPATEPARVRAMYTDPGFTRRGVGRAILMACEDAARDEGFRQLELMSTLSGQPLYAAYGFRPVEEVLDDTGGAAVPLVRMAKPVDPAR
jgi:GNAT superfamily N-acetyltransferase